MILNYIFSIFILITSATGLADLFIRAHLKAQHENSEFIRITQQKLKKFNQSGIGTLLGISLTLIFSLLFYFLILILKTERNEILYRKNTYLCFHYLDKKTKNYISTIAKYNMTLRALAIASSSGALAAEAQATKEALLMTRNIFHFSYLKNIASAPYCQMTDAKDYLKNFPYELDSTGGLITNIIDETTIIKGENWKNIIGHIPNGIRVSKIFVLNAQYSLTSVFDSNPSVKLQEISSQDLLN